MAIQPVTLDKISSTTPAPAVSQTSSSSKNIQTQIASKQQHLKQISSDDTITATEKEQKRRELQKEIDELNRKLQQEKLEQKEEAAEAAKKQEKNAAIKAEILERTSPSEKTATDSSKVNLAEVDKSDNSKDNTVNASTPEDKQKHVDMSVKDIQQMLSADYLVQKERVQEQVDLKKENTINILEGEIRQDKIYGADTTRKEAELEAIQQKENFWSDAQKQTQEAQKQAVNQDNVQAAMNNHAKVVIDQI